MADPDEGRFSRETVPASPSTPRRDGPREDVDDSPFDPPADRFTEKAELGRGGMGRVFEAYDTALDRPVAIKQSLVDDVEIQARFEREVRITARLQHPGIVPVLDAGRDEHGRPFYVMRKIEGRPLAEFVDEAQTVRDRLALVQRLLAAIDAAAYAHARGVIHRDIKPWNVLLGPFGETLVIDWGLAREIDSDDIPMSGRRDAAEGLTQVGATYGTPGFMAPEQARAEHLDRRVDVYALGATLYYVLTGARPFAGATSTRAIEVAATGELPDLDRIPEEVPAALIAIVTKAMAPARDDRYPDANALAEDLRRFLSGQLVAAHRYTSVELAARWLRRHRLAVAIAGIAVLVIAILSTLAIRSIIDERDGADSARAREAARADDLLVERADAIVTQDPARALALLKQLRPSSPAWERAQSVADTALWFGVGWGRMLDVRLSDSKIARVIASADGTHVAVMTADKVTIVEPSLRTPERVIAKLPLAASKAAAWVDGDKQLVIADQANHLISIDVASGVMRPLDSDIPVERLIPPATDGRLLALAGGKLRAIDLDGGKPQPITCGDGGVERADRIDGATVCSTATRLWFQRDGVAPVLVYEGSGAGAFQVSPEAKRVAIVAPKSVEEWDISGATPVPHGHWAVEVRGVGYSQGSDLVGFDAAGAMWLGLNGVVGRDLQMSLYATRRGLEILLVSTRRGLATSMPGTLRVFQSGRSMMIGGRVEPMVSLDLAGAYLIGVNQVGVLRSWNLDDTLPKVIGEVDGASPFAMNDNFVWLMESGTQRLIAGRLVDNDRQLEKVAEFDSSYIRCSGPGRSVLTEEPTGGHTLDLVDFEAKVHAHAEGDILGVACAADASTVAVLMPSKLVLVDVRKPATPTDVPLEHGLHNLAVEGRWVVWVDDTNTLVRYDTVTHARVSMPIAGVDQIGVEADGRVSFVRGGEVSVWAGNQTPATSVFTAHAIHLIAPSSAGLIVVTDDNAVALVDHDRHVRSYQTGSRTRPTVAHRDPFVLITDLDENLALLDPRNGALRKLPWWADRATVGNDGRTVFGTLGDYALISRTTIPRDPAGLRAWVMQATNATLEPGSTRLSWP